MLERECCVRVHVCICVCKYKCCSWWSFSISKLVFVDLKVKRANQMKWNQLYIKECALCIVQEFTIFMFNTQCTPRSAFTHQLSVQCVCIVYALKVLCYGAASNMWISTCENHVKWHTFWIICAENKVEKKNRCTGMGISDRKHEIKEKENKKK